MSNVLKLSGRRATRPPLLNEVHRWEEQERQDDSKAMLELCAQLVAERKAHPKPGAKDLRKYTYE